MDFTREPIIETVITPRDGYRLVVRSSKSVGQEEHFVDAVEVICFGHAFFFRCMEKPKPFIVPVGDYEVVEVREPRMALKTLGIDGSIKIGGGKELSKAQKEMEKREELTIAHTEKNGQEATESEVQSTPSSGSLGEVRPERNKRDRRRHQRRRRGREEAIPAEKVTSGEETIPESEPLTELSPSKPHLVQPVPGSLTLLAPPNRLIRDDLDRYRGNEQYKGAFYLKDENMDQDEAELEEGGTVLSEQEKDYREDLFSTPVTSVKDREVRESPFPSFPENEGQQTDPFYMVYEKVEPPINATQKPSSGNPEVYT